MSPARCVPFAAIVLIAGAVLVWYFTGAEGYTRWPNARLAQSDRAVSNEERALLDEIAFTDARDAAPRPDISSRFALGLVPGGFDPAHLLSVSTVAVVALIASAAALWLGRSSRIRSHPARP